VPPEFQMPLIARPALQHNGIARTLEFKHSGLVQREILQELVVRPAALYSSRPSIGIWKMADRRGYAKDRITGLPDSDAIFGE
jgi:hypothetical protein